MVQVAAALLFALAAGLGVTVILAMLKNNEDAILSALLGEGAFPGRRRTARRSCPAQDYAAPFVGAPTRCPAPDPRRGADAAGDQPRRLTFA